MARWVPDQIRAGNRQAGQPAVGAAAPRGGRAAGQIRKGPENPFPPLRLWGVEIEKICNGADCPKGWILMRYATETDLPGEDSNPPTVRRMKSMKPAVAGQHPRIKSMNDSKCEGNKGEGGRPAGGRLAGGAGGLPKGPGAPTGGSAPVSVRAPIRAGRPRAGRLPPRPAACMSCPGARAARRHRCKSRRAGAPLGLEGARP